MMSCVTSKDPIMMLLKTMLVRGSYMEPEIMKFFKYNHLPEHLKLVSKPFCKLAEALLIAVPDNAERAVGLRKLLEAKDCAVRAIL